ncbi:MAG: hypothetical protein APF84_19465 [Gracilibacter sp. BRH_c7a]|nr:MAG: hypothetical protein APF84_19465 [Gracilibacter sp. BRH_c7a]
MKKVLKKILVLFIILGIIAFPTILAIDRYVQNTGSQYIIDPMIIPEADAILVLGAYVFPDGTVSHMLNDRLTIGYDLYSQGKAPKIIVSGDHGQKDYDEVNAMKEFLQDKGVPEEDIFMDHAGFSTYESMYRARDIFKVDKLIIITQEYHLKRAVFIARELGLQAYGVPSDIRYYLVMEQYKLREIAARNKDFFLAKIIKPKPTFLGEEIPVSGDGRQTHDKLNSKEI